MPSLPPTAPDAQPTPYYTDEFVTLYLGDCRQITEWLEADVLITDPPYGTQMVAKGKSAHNVTAGFQRTDDSAVSIIEAHPDKAEQALHIHAKPLALMLRLVAAAPPGVIADPFAGGGGTVAAAKQLGRRIIAVEIDERHCENIARRCTQDTLFGGVA